MKIPSKNPASRFRRPRAATCVAIALLGLAACLPVPIGDPERSRVDDAYNGTWISASADDCVYVVNMRPYDKRTWMVAWYCVHLPDAIRHALDSDAGYAQIMSALDAADIGETEMGVFKGWRVKLAGQEFLTWEPMTFAETPGEDFWYVWNASIDASGRLQMKMVDAEFAEFKDLDEDEVSRRRYESIIRKNVDNESLYDKDHVVYYKVREADMPGLGKVVVHAKLTSW